MAAFLCMWCGKSMADHADMNQPGILPKIPCLGLKKNFAPKGVYDFTDEKKSDQWVPKYNDIYFTIANDLSIHTVLCKDDPHDRYRIRVGNCFRYKSGAEAALENLTTNVLSQIL